MKRLNETMQIKCKHQEKLYDQFMSMSLLINPHRKSLISDDDTLTICVWKASFKILFLRLKFHLFNVHIVFDTSAFISHHPP